MQVGPRPAFGQQPRVPMPRQDALIGDQFADDLPRHHDNAEDRHDQK